MQVLYTVHSERMLMEQLDYNLLSRAAAGMVEAGIGGIKDGDLASDDRLTAWETVLVGTRLSPGQPVTKKDGTTVRTI